MKITRLRPLLPALLLLLVNFLYLAPLAKADEDVTGRPLPKIEAGLALLNFYLPDYPGADESHYRAFPTPYFIYRGETFRADREGGYRGRFIKLENIEFDLSANATFPTDSDKNEARKNMSDLDWLGEVGPRLRYHIVQTPIVKLDFELPVRYVFSTNFQNFNTRGYTLSPGLEFQHRAFLDTKGYYNIGIGGVWATNELMDYFYKIPAHEVTPTRALYDANPGFLALSTRISFVRPITDTLLAFVGFSRSYYALAKNRKSPLLRDLETESYFLGVAWNFYQSDLVAPSDVEDAIAKLKLNHF